MPPEIIDPSKFTAPDQHHDYALSQHEAYEKETDPAKREGILKAAREHTAKAKELWSKERETLKKGSEFKLPEQYKAKPWAASIKTQEDLIKKLDELSAVAEKGGKKEPFNPEGKTPEEIKAHLDSKRPVKPEEYKIGKDTDDQGVLGEFKNMCWEAGLDQFEANTALEKYRAYQEGQKAKLFDPDEFNGMLEKAFGKDFKKEAGTTSNLLASLFESPEEKAFFDQAFPNEQAVLVHKIASRFMKKFGVTEKDFGTGGGRGGSGGGAPTTVEGIEKRQAEIRAEVAKLNRTPHTKEQRSRLISELDSLSSKKHELLKKK